MIIASTIEEVRSYVRQWRREGLSIGLVPTMGALHQGHASLVAASAAQCDRTVASVFVNPTQFAAGEDLECYPRDFARDCRILREKGCHLVFHPTVEEMYPAGFATYVSPESDMIRQLCGKDRPGHFRGVCTVVSKLFHIVTPDKAYFGQKDAQQLAVIRRMVQDLDFDIEVVGCPTVREADGLAKSSRNAYLSEEERRAAGVLYRAMEAGRDVIRQERKKQRPPQQQGQEQKVPAVLSGEAAAAETAAGERISAAAVLAEMRSVLDSEPMAQIDYVEAVDGKTLLPVASVESGDLVALAVQIGKTRLIDNFIV